MLAANPEALRLSGQFAASLRAINSALSQKPNDPEQLLAKGLTLFAWNRRIEAHEYLTRAERSIAGDAELYLHLGWTHFAIGNVELAERWLRRGIEIDPGGWALYSNLAFVFTMQSRLDEAIKYFEHALELKADDRDSLIGLGECRLRQHRPIEAETLFRRAYESNEGSALCCGRLASAVDEQGRHSEALELYERATRMSSSAHDDSDMYVNHATSLSNAGFLSEGLKVLEANLSLTPTVDGYYAYAIQLLSAGRMPAGWRFYEFRWLRTLEFSLRLKSTKPVWTGQSLKDRTILLHMEQGLGDTIQFVRYAKFVKEMGATVYLRTSQPLQDLMRGISGIDQIYGPTDPLPEYDYYCYLMSLPYIYGTDEISIPAEPNYLSVRSALVKEWSTKLVRDERLLVGIAWAGNPEHKNDVNRSMSLDQFSQLLKVEGVRYVSLQKGPSERQIDEHSLAASMDKLGPQLHDLNDTAAAISQLDLVICVDTAIAHLAGALGKPVWVLLPTPADWRWLEHREDSPWYPCMRLFRQQTRGDWNEVIDRVKAALEQRVKRGHAPTSAQVAPRPSVLTSRPQLVGQTMLPGHQPGLSAVAETRLGPLQYLPDEPFVGDAIAQRGEYLQPYVDLLSTLIAPGSTVMEIDAGVGLHALALAQMVGQNGHLMLYEPDNIKRRILSQNLDLHGIRNATIMQRQIGGIPEAESEPASSTGKSDRESLDDLQLERLDWLKVKGERRALEVVSRAEETIWRLRPNLLIAGDDRGTSMNELQDRLQDFGYTCSTDSIRRYNSREGNRRNSDTFRAEDCVTLIAIPEERGNV